jgi:hypothetical protein
MANHRKDTVPSAVRAHETLSFSVRVLRSPLLAGDDDYLEGSCSCSWGYALLLPDDPAVYRDVIIGYRIALVDMWRRHLLSAHPDFTIDPEPEEPPTPEGDA